MVPGVLSWVHCLRLAWPSADRNDCGLSFSSSSLNQAGRRRRRDPHQRRDLAIRVSSLVVKPSFGPPLGRPLKEDFAWLGKLTSSSLTADAEPLRENLNDFGIDAPATVRLGAGGRRHGQTIRDLVLDVCRILRRPCSSRTRDVGSVTNPCATGGVEG